MSLVNNTTAISFDHCGWPVVQISYRRHPPPIRYLDLGSYPFLLLVTTVGNILNLIVLRMNKHSGSKRIYISAVAVLDLIYMWFAIVTYISNYDGELNGYPRPSVRAFVNRLKGLAMFLQETCLIASAWLIVAFTVERFLAIGFPLKHLIISHGMRSMMVVTTVISLSAIIATFRFVDYYWFYANFIGIDLLPVFMPVRPPALMRWYSTYLWALAIIQIATFTAILVLNILLLRVMLRQHRVRRESLHVMHNSDHSRQSAIDMGAVAMLLACAALYLVTQTPGFIGNVLYLMDKACIRPINPATRSTLEPVLNFLLNINFSANFLLYCGANPRFRQNVGGLFHCTSADKRKSEACRRESTKSTKSESLATRQSRLSVCSNLQFRL